MNAPLASIASYSEWVYALANRHPFVTRSTLVLIPIGATLARLEGCLECFQGLTVEVWELVDFSKQQIRTYSYEIYRHGEKVCWYDPWAHPEIPALAATFPHHRHLPPNLRENRVPAPGLRFDPQLGRSAGGYPAGLAPVSSMQF